MTQPRPARPLRLDADADDLGHGLGRLVLAVLELVRQLLERQVLRRVDGGSLTADEIERLGRALMSLDERFAELREIFGDVDDELGSLLRLHDIDLAAGPGPTTGNRPAADSSLGKEPS
nr:gas vesicle protein K [uncultured Actinoplanes sp.]